MSAAVDRVRAWLARTAVGDVARVHGAGCGPVSTDDLAALLDDHDELGAVAHVAIGDDDVAPGAVLVACTELVFSRMEQRTRADAAETECARLRASARDAARVLIAEVGASAPADVGDAARWAIARIDSLTADRDYWRIQATAAAPCVDAIRALTTRVIPGGTRCVVDPARVADTVLASLDGLMVAVDRAESERYAERRQVARMADDLGAAEHALDDARARLDDVAAACGLPAEWDGEWGDRVRGLRAERDAERALRREHGQRIGWAQSIAAAAMRQGLAECRALRAAVRGLMVRYGAALTNADDWREECARLRAIVEGRTVAPTEAEICAHDGAWIVRYVRPRDPRRGERVAFVGVGWRQNARDLAANYETTWWLPLDRDGRPAAWPNVEASR